MEILREIRNNLANQVETVDNTIETIDAYEKELQQLNQIASNQPVSYGTHFIISSLFLRDLLDYLSQWAVESIAYLTGVLAHGVMVIDHLVPFEMDVQEVTYVSGDIVSSTEALCSLDDKGFVLAATAHSHPGSGAGATNPSGVDMQHHQMLETNGYKAAGIIMTRDGYFRCYSKDMPFTVQVVGSDVQEISPNTYKLITVMQEHDESSSSDDYESKGKDEDNEKRSIFRISKKQISAG